MNKLTIEKFRQLKNAIISVIDVEMLNLEMSKNEYEEPTFEQKNQELINKFINLQKELLSYDLSEIPFEEWKGMYLYNVEDGYLDLSVSRANIDFSLLKDYNPSEYILNGCTIRSLELLNLRRCKFDLDFEKRHSNFFPDRNLPEEIRNKFFDNELSFRDLITYPELRKSISAKNFLYDSKDYSSELIKIMGFENALRFFDECPNFVVEISRLFMRESKINDLSYEEIKKYIFQVVVDKIHTSQTLVVSQILKTAPEEMQNLYPNIFINKNEVPEEIIDICYEGKLSLSSMRYYQDFLKGKDIEIYMKNGGVEVFDKVFGGIWNYFEKYPRELDVFISKYLEFVDKQDLIEISKLDPDDFIAFAIKYSANNNSYLFSSFDTIYLCSKYAPLNSIVYDEELSNFINYCGIDKLYEYNQKYNGILDIGDKSGYHYSRSFSFLYLLSSAYKDYEQVDINNVEDLEKYIASLIKHIRSQGEQYHYAVEVLYHNSQLLKKYFPSDILDFEKLKQVLGNKTTSNINSLYVKLFNGINGDTNNLIKLIETNPELIDIFNDIDIIINNYELSTLYNGLGKEVFLQLCLSVGIGLIQISIDQINEIVEVYNTNPQVNLVDMLNDAIAKSLESSRKLDIRSLSNSFKQRHPEIYLKDDAPEDLVYAFYERKDWDGYEFLKTGEIYNHPQWIPHLKHLNLRICFKLYSVNAYNGEDSLSYAGMPSRYKEDFINVLYEKFSTEEILDIFAKYGNLFDTNMMYYIEIDTSLSKEKIYAEMMGQIYRTFVQERIKYNDQMPEEFKAKYPHLFIMPEEFPAQYQTYDELSQAFYSRSLTPQMINEHPEWKIILRDKLLSVVFDQKYAKFLRGCEKKKLDNEKILYKLFECFGNYLGDYEIDSISLQGTTYEEIENSLKKSFIYEIINRRQSYNHGLKKVLGSLREDLFLEDNAPEELKLHFYNADGRHPLTFELLKQHKDWLPLLKGKNILLSLTKNPRSLGIKYLFERYGEDEAIRIGMKNPESVMKMITLDKEELLCQWYDKLHFIPHYVVMTRFPIELSDKFIASGKKWSQIMRLEEHSFNEEGKDALLKASMCFGVFDQDAEGFNKVMQLFSGIPHSMNAEYFSYISEYIANLGSSDKEENKQKAEELSKLFAYAYSQTENGSYVLKINDQENRDLVAQLRKTMLESGLPIILNASRAHQLFGGFVMSYSPDFRDFLCQNIEEILDSDNYISSIKFMQKKWDEIKAWNKNRSLTLKNAMLYIKANKYDSVELGNTRASELVGMEGYPERDWQILQQIYNYGKLRTFSSIPRVTGTEKGYTYEILRLDDPMALIIGKLTDCCQELGDNAESCMEHSMVAKCGRIFIIRDAQGSVISQSWVWRNRNVICFDNIEVPDRQMREHGIPRGQEDAGIRNEFTDEVLAVYLKAAQEIFEIDIETYKRLYEEGKITEEQYETLKIGKVTVGHGYSNIKGSFATLPEDGTDLIHPQEFSSPVLHKSLYTNDSESTQYILAGSQEVLPAQGESYTLYYDDFKICDDSNTTISDSMFLQMLEKAIRDYSYNTQTYNKTKIVSDIANNYDLSAEQTRIILNANFAIIYEMRDEEIYIADILFNDKVLINDEPMDITNVVASQIKLAIKQINPNGKSITLGELNEKQMQMYELVCSLDESFENERGLK